MTAKDSASRDSILIDGSSSILGKNLVTETRKETCCRSFDMCTVDSSRNIGIFGLFGTEGGLTAHENSELIKTGFPKIMELLIENGLQMIVGRRIA